MPVSIDATFRAWQEVRDRQHGVRDASSAESCLRSTDLRRLGDGLFSEADATAGAENELQVAVRGRREDVDLPRQIESSRFYDNLGSGKGAKRRRFPLERYLEQNPEGLWENSWVCFPARTLAPATEQVFLSDLHSERGNLQSPLRSDSERFLVRRGDDIMLRIPVSYLLKLAQIDAVHSVVPASPAVQDAGRRFSEHFLSDNTSPETLSYAPVSATGTRSLGESLAAETSRRFLLTQLLVQYANTRFHLQAHGQEVLVFNSPNPPVRQRFLNTCLSDAFYRELFMSPCLSGWKQGEEKQLYMGLCHEVLSRSKINAVKRLKEAGIIVNNLVVPPHTSNVSLSNNGMHISFGSRRLTAALGREEAGFAPAHEKYIGDLALKCAEHFLPLFIGTYSAAPYRLAFGDFHPEEVLGFLPHEVDHDRLRMLWHGWKRKAHNQLLGRPITPFGPVWLDTLLSRLFRWKGDVVPDHRLLDYLVALGSTDASPALDGSPGNDVRLKQDLAMLGVFDARMGLYQPGRLRLQGTHGFSGVEYRHYSQFPRFREDLGAATDLQRQVTAHAYALILSGKLRHEDIPDTPAVESERRQLLFATAIGLPGFYISPSTPNRFLRSVLARTAGVRPSRRHPGYAFVPAKAYQQALCQLLAETGSPSPDLMRDLQERITHPTTASATARLTRPALDALGVRSPLHASAEAFNLAIERTCREELREAQRDEALALLLEDARSLDLRADTLSPALREALHTLAGDATAEALLLPLVARMREGRSNLEDVVRLIHFTLLVAEDAAIPCQTTAGAYA